MSKRGGTSPGSKTKMTGIHITSESNIDSILNSGFDLSLSGSEGGDVWGDGVYFTFEDKEIQFYKSKLNSSSGISATIDTSEMLSVEINGKAYSPGNMYDIVVSQLPSRLRQDYENSSTKSQRKRLVNVIKEHYTGLIITQTGVSSVEGTTGGSQIVVYDTRAIKALKKVKL